MAFYVPMPPKPQKYTEEEVLSSKEYREGYETYEYFKNPYKDDVTWRGKHNQGMSPYGNNSTSSPEFPVTSHDLWMAGAFSAYGQAKGHRAAFTKPIVWEYQPEQLDLFD